jgi:hypothetical protein
MGFFKNLFANHLSRELKELYLSSIILRFAFSAIAIFEPIYFLRVGMSFGDILLFYGVMYLLYFFGLPLGGRLARLHGYEHVMAWSSPFLIIYFISLFALPYNPFFLIAALLAAVIYKCLYWPGFHADFARFGRSENRGKEISALTALLSAVSILGPIFGGFVISIAGFQTLFVIVSALALFSNIPMLITPEKFTPLDFSYPEAVKEVFKKKNWRQTISLIGYSEDLIFTIAWPIFIATVIKSLLALGALISASILLNTVVIILIGSFVDKHKRLSVEKLGTVLTSFVWFGAAFIKSGLGVFLFDNFYRTTRHVLGAPLMSIIYDEAKNSSVMKVMIFREMSLAFGKVIGAILAIALWLKFPDKLNYLFVLAGLLTLFYLLLKERVRKDGFVVPPVQPDVTAPIVISN